MSLLNRAGLNRHLDEGALSQIWTASASSGQPASDPHLAGCQQCRTRYAAFTAWLDGLRDEAHAEADAVFTPDRLAAQQAHVMRRLEALERPARVIAFPRFTRPVTSTHGHVQRWIAGAAAAGLVIGLAAGQFVDIRDAFGGWNLRTNPIESGRTTAVTARSTVSVTPASATAISDEQLFFGDAVDRVRISTLQPMDDITPRARDLDVAR